MSAGESASNHRELPKPRTDHSILTTVVPSLYVDIIGRLIPGVVILTVLFTAVSGWSGIQTVVSEPNVFKAGLFLTCAHVVGLLFAAPLASVLRTRRDRHTGDPLTPETLSAVEEARRFDFVKYIDPDAGHRISKLRAEAHLSIGICGGCAAALVIIGVRFLAESSWNWQLGIVAALGLVTSIATAKHVRRANRRAILNTSELHGFDHFAPPAWVATQTGSAIPSAPSVHESSHRSGSAT